METALFTALCTVLGLLQDVLEHFSRSQSSATTTCGLLAAMLHPQLHGYYALSKLLVECGH